MGPNHHLDVNPGFAGWDVAGVALTCARMRDNVRAGTTPIMLPRSAVSHSGGTARAADAAAHRRDAVVTMQLSRLRNGPPRGRAAFESASLQEARMNHVLRNYT
jgi:hypothetical protein